MNYSRAAKKMVNTQLVPRGISDPQVLTAMAKVPRHLFVEEALHHKAYEDYPLPIGEAQTISQPYIVALMTEALELTGNETVLEIGTGSGYQTAILAELTRLVFTIERIPTLASKAEKNLRSLGYRNVVVRTGDGTGGWPEMAPYQGIIVTAGAPSVPQLLKDQLDIGGRLVIPVGDQSHQTLLRIRRVGPELFTTDRLTGCVFVNLIGEYGWKED